MSFVSNLFEISATHYFGVLRVQKPVSVSVLSVSEKPRNLQKWKLFKQVDSLKNVIWTAWEI